MYHRLKDPDPNPAPFVSDTQNANKFFLVSLLIDTF
jgi:hypothetical protein